MYEIKFDNGLIVSNVASLSTARHSLSAINVGPYAFFAGGKDAENEYKTTVDIFALKNKTLTFVKTLDLTTGRSNLAGT